MKATFTPTQKCQNIQFTAILLFEYIKIPQDLLHLATLYSQIGAKILSNFTNLHDLGESASALPTILP